MSLAGGVAFRNGSKLAQDQQTRPAVNDRRESGGGARFANFRRRCPLCRPGSRRSDQLNEPIHPSLHRPGWLSPSGQDS